MRFIFTFLLGLHLSSMMSQTVNKVEVIGKLTLINNPGDSSMYLGLNAGISDDQTDNENMFIGVNAGVSNTIGNDNQFMGIESGKFNISGNDNLFVGRLSGFANTLGSSNTFLGRSAGRDNTTGLDNTFVGRSAGLANTGGIDNVFLGRSAGAANTNGRDNTFLGKSAGAGNTSADDNTCIGRLAGHRHRLGNNNTYIGESSGVTDSLGFQNTIVGANADILVHDIHNSGAYGYLALATSSNQIIIGNSAITEIGGYSSWATLSDGRYKVNVKKDVPGLNFIMKLNPVTYNMDNSKLNNYLYHNPSPKGLEMNDKTLTGFIAQEVAQAAVETNFNFSGVVLPKDETEQYKLKYAEFVVPLTKAIQEQQVMIQDLMSEVALLKQTVNELKKL
jgi:trimeric autotransporter adhesin